MPRGGKGQTVEDLIIKKEEVEKRLSKLLEQTAVKRNDTIEKIDSLDDCRHIEVLENSFIYNLTFEEIAENTGYSVRHIARLYKEALTKINI